MMPITARRPIHGAHLTAAVGRIGMAMRMKPYVPSFSMTAARITEPWVGAWVWASGSQVWNGNIGTFTAKPTNIPAKIQTAVVVEKSPDFTRSATRLVSSVMLNVVPPVFQNSARKAISMSADPNIV